MAKAVVLKLTCGCGCSHVFMLLQPATFYDHPEAMKPFLGISLLVLVLAGVQETAVGQPANQDSHDATVVETLTPEEAKKALGRVSSAEREPGPGTWCKRTFEPGETNILYEWRPSEKLVLRRKETVTLSPTNSNQIIRRVCLDNSEGSWTLIGDYAYARDWPLEEKHDMEGWPGDKASGETLLKAMLMELKDPQLARAAKVTGERIKRGTATRLHLVEVYDDQAQKRVVELMQPPIKELKKQIPLLLRPILTTSMLTKALMTEMPRRKELLIDEASSDVLERCLYLADGTFLTGEALWAKCPDLLETKYAVPDGMKRMALPTIANAPVQTSKSGFHMDDEHSITLKGDDVVLVSVPSGPTALVQFTSVGTNGATYRWSCRANKTTTFETGTGTLTRVVVVSKDSAGHTVEQMHPGNDTTIRAGLIWLKWRPAKAGSSEVFYEPKRVKVKKLNKGAFDADPE